MRERANVTFMPLELYRGKRNFRNTPEPRGRTGKRGGRALSFVIQKHAASHLHYDFRLELDGILLSWAVPKGPSLDPAERRLAIHVEDHPLEYGSFEGVIPPKQYGSGTVMLWDTGTWTPDGDPREGYRKGRLKFHLDGEKLKGGWMLVKSLAGKYGGEKSWLLFKLKDEFAQPAAEGRVTDDEPLSVATGRSLEGISANSDRVWSSRKSVRENVAAGAIQPPRKGRAASVSESELVAGVAISNPGKLLYPDAGITKVQLASYYETVGDWMVPHLKDRPLMLVRCPDGWNKECFHQKNAPDRIHRAITPVVVQTSQGEGIYMMANSTEAVVALLQSGALELHPWGSKAGKLDKPDRIIFDFDPDEGIGFREVADAAKLVRDMLEKLGLRSFVKTTGGKGLHVVVPIQPTQDWAAIKAFTRAIAESLSSTFPQRFTATASKAQRKGRLFVDYLRNAEGATAIAPYSIRARENAPVATPIAWEELARDVRFDHFNLRNVPARLQKMKNDPWAEFFTVKQRITAAMMKGAGA